MSLVTNPHELPRPPTRRGHAPDARGRWDPAKPRPRAGAPTSLAISLCLVAATVVTGVLGVPSASAVPSPVSLGSAAGYAVLGGSTVTNTGATKIIGDLGLSPGTSVTGIPPGQVNGTQNIANSAALQAKNDLVTAYNDVASRPTTGVIPVELGGTTMAPGVYASPAGTFGITGTVTLDAGGDPNAVFIFKAASTLITASSSSVELVNGAKACNVFWQVGSSATLGTYSIIRGNVMALASITSTTGVTVDGRLLAREAAVTLDTATITRSSCVPAPPVSALTTTNLATSVNPCTVGQPVTFTATVSADTGTAIPGGLMVFIDSSDLIGIVAVDSTGKAVLTTTTLSPGLHVIRAVYIGGPGFAGSWSPMTFELVLVPTTFAALSTA
jgi:hypothetical protein